MADEDLLSGVEQASPLVSVHAGTTADARAPSDSTIEHVHDPNATYDHPSDAERRLDSDPDAPSVPGYRVVRTLGHGGMGVVYLARHAGLNRLVALKMISGRHHAGSGLLARFRAEAEAVARLKHPSIIQIYDVGEADGCPYLSLEYLEGGSLAQRFNGTPQPPREAAELVCVLARAMYAAHEGGVIHRDLKPANILLATDGHPKIADFGLAKQIEDSSGQTLSGSILGTPSYMAPEQADGRVREVGTSADVYALGAILYEALTGRPPFRGASMLETLEQVRTQEPVAPTFLQSKTPRDLETICLTCLQKERSRRYVSAEALADDLQRFLNHEPIQARSVTTWERLVRWRRRNPAVAALLGVSAFILLAGVVTATSFAVVAYNRADRISSINSQLLETTKESEDRGDLALKTLESVVQDVQTELASVPNAQKLRGRLLNRAMDGLQRLDEKLRTQKRADFSTALALLNMAEVFRQVGGETGSKGPAMANTLFERSISSFEKLLEQTPDHPETAAKLADAYLLYGINLCDTDDSGWELSDAAVAELKERPLMQRGLKVHKQAADLRRRLLDADPNDANAKYELARALNEWAYQETRVGDEATTKRILDDAFALAKQLKDADPTDLRSHRLYAKVCERIGSWYFDMKRDYTKCEPHFRESLAICQELARRRPHELDVQFAYATAWYHIADVHVERKELQAALHASQQELAITQRIEKLYPDNVSIVVECSISYDHNYRDNFALGNFEAARDMVRKAFDMRLPLIDADPDNRRNYSLLGRTTKRLGGVNEKLNQTAEAVKAYETGLAKLTEYRERSKDKSVDRDIADIQKALAKLGRKTK